MDTKLYAKRLHKLHLIKVGWFILLIGGILSILFNNYLTRVISFSLVGIAVALGFVLWFMHRVIEWRMGNQRISQWWRSFELASPHTIHVFRDNDIMVVKMFLDSAKENEGIGKV